MLFFSEKSAIAGIKSSPILFTNQEPASVLIIPLLIKSANIDPSGSANTNSVLFDTFLKKCVNPVIVPDEPTPTITASTS